MRINIERLYKEDLEKKYNEGKVEGESERKKLEAEIKRLKNEIKKMKLATT